MAKTLTDIGIQKIGQRFVDSVHHANYTLDGEPKTVPPFRTIVNGPDVRVGDVANVELVDKDGDIIATSDDKVFTKTPGKGLYVAFKYNVKEMEVESSGVL